MKKWTSLCLCLLAVFCLLLITPKASAATSGIYTYKVTNREATITDCDTSASGDITIPDKLGGYPVTTIGEYAFSQCNKLTSITLSANVKTLEHCAFFDCTKLRGIWVVASNPYFVSDDQGVLFTSDMKKLVAAPGTLTEYRIPNTVTTIAECAFNLRENITSVTIPASVTLLEYNAFEFCENLTDVYIEDFDAWCNVKSEGGDTMLFCYGKTHTALSEQRWCRNYGSSI